MQHYADKETYGNLWYTTLLADLPRQQLWSQDMQNHPHKLPPVEIVSQTIHTDGSAKTTPCGARAGYAAFREEEERAEAAFMEQLQREDEEAWEDEEPWEGETEDEFFDNADDDFSY